MVHEIEKGGSEKEPEKVIEEQEQERQRNQEEHGRVNIETLTPEQMEHAQEHLDKIEAPMPKEKRESGPEILEFVALVNVFESTHSLEALSAITQLSPDLLAFIMDRKKNPDPKLMSAKELESAMENLTPEDARTYSMMVTAKKDFERPDGVFGKWKILKNETDITPDRLAELTLQRKRLSAAIGTIQAATGAVDHSIR
ncbi:MAG: hypothetical protein Q7S86_04500 [bacterium]|nr:hypothetical protein [bacterium]